MNEKAAPGQDIPTSLPVYIQDASYTAQEDQSDWEERSIALKASLEKEFGCAFQDADIWPGASLPAFVVQLAGEAWPYLAMALYVFFKGKDIEENLDAWPKLYERINPFRKYKPYFNREGSAVLALKAIREALGHEPSSIRLVGYRATQVGEPPLDWDAVTGIDDGPTELYVGWVAHLFRIEADGRLFNVAVEQNEVFIVEG